MNRRALVAMSGGVDSSVAAALLLERGNHVTGITMRLWQESRSATIKSISSAAQVCQQLGIRHQTVDLSACFRQQVVDYFIDEYARGRTPNPCVRCNRHLKFGALLENARQQGAMLATGHYARIIQRGGFFHLLSGLDERKDQSYFLYTLGQQELAHTLFPLGIYSKTQVREMARRRGLIVAQRDESQDVCFISDGDYRRFLREHAPQAVRPGPILLDGRALGQHKGLPFYTIGQREGLGISAPKPLYVIALDVMRNALIVGYAEDLGRNALLASDMHYVADPPTSGGAVEAKIRYRARRATARIWPLSGQQARIVFEQPLRDITPGQSVVVYRGDRVLGGGTIERSYSV